MPYISQNLLKQWERQYKHLLRMQHEHGKLTFDQQRQWDFLVPIFEGGNSADDLRDHGASGIREEHLGKEDGERNGR